MFAFLARLRMTGGEPTQDDGDDTSSLNRSLNLPWPVTESAPQRLRAGSVSTTAPRVQTSGQWAPPPPAMTISYPIPRTTPNSLTGVDEHSGSGSTLGRTNGARPARSVPPQVASSSSAWYEAEKPRRLGVAAPPQVIRLDSGALQPDTSDDEETAPPTYYSTYANGSADALSQTSLAHSGYVTAPGSVASNNAAALPPRPSRPEIAFADDEGEFYMSPFDSDAEDAGTTHLNTASTSALVPTSKPGTMPKARWGLKLQLNAPRSMPALPRGGTGPVAPLPHPPAPRKDSAPGVAVETDVYAHAYSYPLAKQLSPIAEQDYVSPVVDSPARTASRKTSAGGESLAGGAATMMRGDEAAALVEEALRTRTGSVRTGSGGSVGTASVMGSLSRAGSLSKSQVTGSPSEIMRPSPVYSSPFLTRHLNRTVSQSSSKSDTQSQGTQGAATPTQHTPTQPARQLNMHLMTAGQRNASNPTSVNTPAKEVILTPTSADTTGTATGTMYTPTSTFHGSGGQTPTSPIKPTSGGSVAATVPPPQPAMTIARTPVVAPTLSLPMPKIPSLPTIGPLDLRFSHIGVTDAPTKERGSKGSSVLRQGIAGVDRMPVIHSVEGHHDPDEDDEEEDDEYDIDIEEAEDDDGYERESLHAESFVTAGTSDDAHERELGMELATLPTRDAASWKTQSEASVHSPVTPNARESLSLTVPGDAASTGDSFILRRWNTTASAASPTVTSPTALGPGAHPRWPFRAPSREPRVRTPAFWMFWLGFIMPMLWFVGGWAFTHAGERPPRVSAFEWYFWRSGWSLAAALRRLLVCCAGRRRSAVRGSVDSAGSSQPHTPSAGPSGENSGAPPAGRRRGKRRSGAAVKARAGQVYPALPHWITEKQRTDDGRMRLNDPKRSMRGISFGYPFVARPGGSQDSAGARSRRVGRLRAVLTAPNRAFDLLYGVRLMEVRGRPESGRRMFDPWIQRCRYALCYAVLVLAIGLCIACAWLITVNTRQITRS